MQPRGNPPYGRGATQGNCRDTFCRPARPGAGQDSGDFSRHRTAARSPSWLRQIQGLSGGSASQRPRTLHLFSEWSGQIHARDRRRDGRPMKIKLIRAAVALAVLLLVGSGTIAQEHRITARELVAEIQKQVGVEWKAATVASPKF